MRCRQASTVQRLVLLIGEGNGRSIATMLRSSAPVCISNDALGCSPTSRCSASVIRCVPLPHCRLVVCRFVVSERLLVVSERLMRIRPSASFLRAPMKSFQSTTIADECTQQSIPGSMKQMPAVVRGAYPDRSGLQSAVRTFRKPRLQCTAESKQPFTRHCYLNSPAPGSPSNGQA